MDTLLLVVIINTVLCVLGILPAFGVQIATVMGGASIGTGALGGVIALAGYIFPAMPIISIVGSWIAYWVGPPWLVMAFMALPWAYLLALGVCVGIFFGKGKSEP
jgi:hypothetical protein